MTPTLERRAPCDRLSVRAILCPSANRHLPRPPRPPPPDETAPDVPRLESPGRAGDPVRVRPDRSLPRPARSRLPAGGPARPRTGRRRQVAELQAALDERSPRQGRPGRLL